MSDQVTTDAPAPTEVQPTLPTVQPTLPAEHPAIETLRAIELDVLTGYTLADAMREGASVTQQKFGGWLDGNSACAFAAAYLAARARGFV